MKKNAPKSLFTPFIPMTLKKLCNYFSCKRKEKIRPYYYYNKGKRISKLPIHSKKKQ